MFLNRGGRYMEEEKNGTILVDGKIINLDNISEEELQELERRLELKEEEIRDIIEKQVEE